MRIVMPCLHVEPWARLRSACCGAAASAYASCGHNAENAYRRFVPLGDLSRCSKYWRKSALAAAYSGPRAIAAHCFGRHLLDNLVGARKEGGRYVQSERLGGREVDDQLELGRELRR